MRTTELAVILLALRELSVCPQQAGNTACAGYPLPLSCLLTVLSGESMKVGVGGRVKG